MNQRSSSTSSSDTPWNRKRALWAVPWTIFGLFLIDLAVNVAFAYPSDPKATSASRAQLYFDYGRSAEGKLARVTRPTPDKTAPITLAGWYEPLRATFPGGEQREGTITFYGMSHSVRLAEALERTSSRYSARSVAAPGATTAWAYGAFRRDSGRRGSKAAVLSIMSLNMPMITTMSAMSWNTAFPLPYTSDRFVLREVGLAAVPPPYASFGSYVEAFYDPQKWDQARARFARHDPIYDDFLMHRSLLDQSAIGRLVRRGYGQRGERLLRSRVLDQKGFNPASEEVRLANAIVRQFAIESRREGIVPVVFIVNNFGYSDHLYEALRVTLQRERIPFVSSHTLVSPQDPRGYLPDTHFTDANDNRLAQALEGVVDAELARSRPASR